MGMDDGAFLPRLLMKPIEKAAEAFPVVVGDAELARPSILYWRTAGGEEVDIVVETQGKLLAVEAKAVSRPTHRDARHLRSFLDEYQGTAHGALLLHGGATTEWLGDRVLSAPWWRVL